MNDTYHAHLRAVRAALGHRHAFTLARTAADSRTVVRTLFLASAVRSGIIDHLRSPASFDELCAATGAARPERLRAWLTVGTELHELALRHDRYSARSRRARVLAAGDELLRAHYRSFLDYQTGPYDDLLARLHDAPDAGRDDLVRHAEVIAEVSRAAAPFLIPWLRTVVAERRPGRVLDAGCGTGVYLEAVLQADPDAVGDAFDVSPEAVASCRQRLTRAGLRERAHVTIGEITEWSTRSRATYDLVMLCNNVYYFDPDRRVDVYAALRPHVHPAGELLVASMCTPGSVAAAHLDLMMRSQAGRASLPTVGSISDDLRRAGYRVAHAVRLVPTEPFVAVRARVV